MKAAVIVIGGGPSGAAAAAELARGGVDVLLLERFATPARKPCGGGLSPKVPPLLCGELWPKNAVALAGTTLRLSRGGAPLAIRASEDRPVGWVVDRIELDEGFRRWAEGLGARILPGEKAIAVERHGTGLKVLTTRDTHRAQWVVGADGARSVAGRWLCWRSPWEKRVAMVAEVPGAFSRGDLEGRWAQYDFTAVPWGYGWVFPRGEVVSVGVGSIRPVRHLGRFFWRFVRASLPEVRWEDVTPRGHLIPRGGRSRRLCGEGVVLVGDAAGLVDPFLGEGIPFALESGRRAARSLLETLRGETRTPSSYTGWVRRHINRDFRAGRLLSWFFYRNPAAIERVVRHSPSALLWVHQWMAGSISYRKLCFAMVRRLPRLLRAMGL